MWICLITGYPVVITLATKYIEFSRRMPANRLRLQRTYSAAWLIIFGVVL
jgi:hypothetical protein